LWTSATSIAVTIGLSFFNSAFLFFLLFFLIVAIFNLYHFAKWQNNLGLDSEWVYIENKYMKSKFHQFKIDEITGIQLKRSPIRRGNMRFEVKFHYNGKRKGFIFQKEYWDDLIEFGKMMSLRGVDVRSDL
jgi:hypothetical protein